MDARKRCASTNSSMGFLRLVRILRYRDRGRSIPWTSELVGGTKQSISLSNGHHRSCWQRCSSLYGQSKKPLSWPCFLTDRQVRLSVWMLERRFAIVHETFGAFWRPDDACACGFYVDSTARKLHLTTKLSVYDTSESQSIEGLIYISRD